MYYVNLEIADFLMSVLNRTCRNPKRSRIGGKACFDVEISSEDFRNCLARAICEAKEDRRHREQILHSFESNDGEPILVPQELFLTKEEASRREFVENFIGDSSFSILEVDPDFTSDQDHPDEIHTYCVDQEIADSLEKILIRCLYRFERNGNMFSVLAYCGQFERVVSLACAKPVIPNVTALHDIFSLLDEEEIPDFDPKLHCSEILQ